MEIYSVDENLLHGLIEHDALLIETLSLLQAKIVETYNKTNTPKTIGTGINCLAAGASVGSILGGMALAPLTAGVSLGLAVGGLAGILTGTGINVAADLFKGKKLKEHLAQLNLLAEEHDHQLRKLVKDLNSGSDPRNEILIEYLLKDYKVNSKEKTFSARNLATDAVTLTGRVGVVLDAREATKIPHVVSEITTNSASTGLVITGAAVSTGLAVTGAVASIGFAVWDVVSLIRKWGQTPTADTVEKLRLEIEKERDWLKKFFNV
ncbi:uncharacterized protein LOC110861210 [Folsomia candida]|uniref:Apolipoprotein L3 n=1 Tax=Folsomia candida TaxID=158441 RepID=A0A226D3Y3_FOLCA|nr:uncharacterized protein LOC110861210 [Folsomia candida]OXA39574.1 hypothetical protein Fcan01_25657 [Folsomia candida]